MKMATKRKRFPWSLFYILTVVFVVLLSLAGLAPAWALAIGGAAAWHFADATVSIRVDTASKRRDR